MGLFSISAKRSNNDDGAIRAGIGRKDEDGRRSLVDANVFGIRVKLLTLGKKQPAAAATPAQAKGGVNLALFKPKPHNGVDFVSGNVGKVEGGIGFTPETKPSKAVQAYPAPTAPKSIEDQLMDSSLKVEDAFRAYNHESNPTKKQALLKQFETARQEYRGISKNDNAYTLGPDPVHGGLKILDFKNDLTKLGLTPRSGATQQSTATATVLEQLEIKVVQANDAYNKATGDQKDKLYADFKAARDEYRKRSNDSSAFKRDDNGNIIPKAPLSS